MFSPQAVFMNSPSAFVPILVLLFVVMFFVAMKILLVNVLKGSSAARPPSGISVRSHHILSANEKDFFRSLQAAVGQQYLIFPQLSLQTFLAGHSQSASARISFTNQIDRKRVDFVLVNPQDLCVRLAIELDDRSHEAEDRQRRDAFVQSVLDQAKIVLVRIPAAQSYDVLTLRRQLGLLAKSA
jgi:hypothetical protein